MLKPLFFGLGLANNVLLIVVFWVRRKHDMATVRRTGVIYLLLAIPALYAIYVALREQEAVQYSVFLGIFLAFLALEGVYDFWLKIPFRRNWKLVVPYLCLYYAMNYGFVVMVWQASLARGILMLALFVVQIITNALSHRAASTAPPG